jgi:Domain of unknown function DUF29
METVMGDLYEDDFLLWSESQATLLRRLTAGERVNDRDLDWANLGEEIEAAGRGESRAFESLLTQAVLHRLKQECWRDAGEVPHWHSEEIRFRQEAADASSASMRQRVDLGRINRRAVQRLPATIEGVPPRQVPDLLGVTLDEWLSVD